MDEQATQTLQYAEQLLQEGKRQEARALLAAALKRNPASARTWWVLSYAVEDVKQEMDCLERVLRLDPAHTQARARLDKLKAPPAPAPAPAASAFVFSDEIPAAEEESLIFDLFKPGSAAFQQEIPQPEWASRPVPEPVTASAVDKAPAPRAESSEVPAWAEPPTSPSGPGSPVQKAPRKKRSWILDAFIIGIILCILLAVVAYFILQDLGRGMVQNIQATQAVAQVLTSRPPQSLPPTWTSTLTPSLIPSETPTLTFTPVTPSITPTLLYTLTTTPIPTNAYGIVTGKYPPDFTLTEVASGAQVSLSDYAGQAILIFFWATWCPYCEAEIPDLQSIYEAYQDEGLVVLAIDEGEISSEVTNYRSAHGLAFPILLDPEYDVTGLYGATSIPRHIFIGRGGRIISTITGGLSYSVLENNVRAALRVYPTSTP
jgi:peroxiredoxin